MILGPLFAKLYVTVNSGIHIKKDVATLGPEPILLFLSSSVLFLVVVVNRMAIANRKDIKR